MLNQVILMVTTRLKRINKNYGEDQSTSGYVHENGDKPTYFVQGGNSFANCIPSFFQ
jgi:hypothetical protein